MSNIVWLKPLVFRPLALKPLACAGTVALVVMSTSWPARAEDLPDPTRPPMAQRRAPTGEAPTKSAAPVLQSILTGVGRKPSVIISGRALQIGDSIDNMKLVRVTEVAAFLSGPNGSTTLALTPGSDKLVATLPTSERLAVEPTSAPARRVGLATVPARTPEQNK